MRAIFLALFASGATLSSRYAFSSGNIIDVPSHVPTHWSTTTLTHDALAVHNDSVVDDGYSLSTVSAPLAHGTTDVALVVTTDMARPRVYDFALSQSYLQ